MSKVLKCCLVFSKNSRGKRYAQSDCRLLRRELTHLGHFMDVVLWDDHTVQWADYDIVLPLAVHDYPLHYSEFMDWLNKLEKAKVKVLNPLSVIRWNIDKRYLFQLQEEGVTIADTVLLHRRHAEFPCLDDILKSKGWTDAIIKPVIGADSIDLRRVTRNVNIDEAQLHLEDLLRRGDALLQEYIHAVSSTGEICCVFIKGRFSHAVLKFPKEVHDMSQGLSISPITPSQEAILAAQQVLEAAKKVIPFDKPFLYARVDMFNDKSNGRIILNELELFEPVLYLEILDDAVKKVAQGIVEYVNSVSDEWSLSAEKNGK